MDSAPDVAREALTTVERSGRQALAEMRRLVGLLRTGAEGLTLAPTPGIEALNELIEQVTQAGVAVEVRREGDPKELPAGIDLAAYRLVQESLTNVIKHAGPACALVTLRFTAAALEIEILDDGIGSGVTVGGHGLVGMRERVSLYGGTFEAGPSPGQGFRVSAVLPLESAP